MSEPNPHTTPDDEDMTYERIPSPFLLGIKLNGYDCRTYPEQVTHEIGLMQAQIKKLEEDAAYKDKEIAETKAAVEDLKKAYTEVANVVVRNSLTLFALIASPGRPERS